MLFGAAIAAATLYLGALFWLAAWRDRGDGGALLQRYSGWVYGLSLAVYCTSWTFFGGVGTAATAGLDFLPIYFGPILVFTLGYSLVRKILAQAKAQHSTSIADFLSARYGKSASVAALVTIIATVGSLPYMALQLQSVGNSLLTLDPSLGATVALDELVLLIAGLMALFAILFGSRRADQAGDNAGMVLTIAVEAVVKLIALLAVAGLALALLLSGGSDVSTASMAAFSIEQIDARFWVLTIIAACAALCLPRQFHMTFVEADTDRPDRAMHWVFPAYLVLTSVVIVPIALAGMAALPAGADPDTIVLALPLATGNEALALLVWIGGFSAAAGMIVVASVALSTMITNDLIAPLVFRRVLSGGGDRSQLADKLLTIRRIVIGALLLAAYAFYLGFGAIGSLAGLGTLAFAAAAQFAPGLVLGVLTRAGNRVGMIAGLATGFVLWLALLIVPAATGSEPVLAIHPDSLVSGVILSLAANCAAYWLGSSFANPNLVDQAQAAAFAGSATPVPTGHLVTRKRVADVRLLLQQFIGKPRADAAIASMAELYRDNEIADEALVTMAERTIAGVVGTSSARMLVGSWAGGEPVPLPEVMAMFDETHRRLSFSGELLQIAIENIDTGVALVDAEMNLVAWNSQYQEMFELPDALIAVGTPIADMIRFNLRQGALDEAEIDEQVARRLDHMRAGREHRMEREQHDGRIMRIIGNPAPGGGYVTSYTDVTADRRAEQALEAKVYERTQQLVEANAALEAATRSKTRFLAAASHDLVQPINAARLFASALGEEIEDEHDQAQRLLHQIDRSITTADRLLRALLDISRLDGTKVEIDRTCFSLDRAFAEIANEFEVQAQAKGLQLVVQPSGLWVETDRGLFVSVLQNFVTNAVRYTESGKVLVGAKRRGDDVQIFVMDQGPGIAADDIERIFHEFTQLGRHHDGEGLGLGLAIVRRIAAMLETDVAVHSELGKGSCFSFALPRIAAGETASGSGELPRQTPTQHVSATVLCVDNDQLSLDAVTALLDRWGMEAFGVTHPDLVPADCTPGLLLLDYRLDDGLTATEAKVMLEDRLGPLPPIVLLTAEETEETARAAEAIGAQRIIKPASPATLRALVNSLLSEGAT